MRKRAAVLASVWICAAAAPSLHADADGARFAALLHDAAPAIVTVRVVTKTTVQMGARSADRESRIEIPGVVVDPGGLIMTSIMPFAPELLLRALSRGDEERMPQLKTVPSEIKVLVEQDEREIDAFLAATDSNLGLAFLQIEDLGGRKLKSVDFSHAANPAVGDVVATVSRLGKGYDSTPYFDTARISGEIGKPRKAWVTDHGLSTLGLPIFSPAGRVVGVLGIVDSGIAETQSTLDGSFGAMMQVLTGGGGMVRPFIVPAAAVAAVIEQARQQAAHMAAERAAKKAVPLPPGNPSHPGKI